MKKKVLTIVFIFEVIVYLIWFYVSLFAYNFSYIDLPIIVFIIFLFIAIIFSALILGVPFLMIIGVNLTKKKQVIYESYTLDYDNIVNRFILYMDKKKKRIIEYYCDEKCYIYNTLAHPFFTFFNNVQQNYCIFYFKKITYSSGELLKQMIKKIDGVYDSGLIYKSYLIIVCVEQENELFEELLDGTKYLNSYYDIIQIIGVSLKNKKVFIPYTTSDTDELFRCIKRKEARKILGLKKKRLLKLD